MEDKLKIDIVKGKLKEWIYYEIKVNEFNLKLQELEDKFCKIQGLSYDKLVLENGSSKTRENLLVEMVEQKAELEKRKSKYYSKLLVLQKELHLEVLNEAQLKILKFVYKHDSYTKAGHELGASKPTIYREMQTIYKALIKFVGV